MIPNVPEALMAQRDLVRDITVQRLLDRPRWHVRLLLRLIPVVVIGFILLMAGLIVGLALKLVSTP